MLGDDTLVDHFMWMGEISCQDGVTLQAYKHYDTRRYLHLTADGNAYWFQASLRIDDPHRYSPIPLPTALEDTLAWWWDSDYADPNEVALARAAIERARDAYAKGRRARRRAAKAAARRLAAAAAEPTPTPKPTPEPEPASKPALEPAPAPDDA